MSLSANICLSFTAVSNKHSVTCRSFVLHTLKSNISWNVGSGGSSAPFKNDLTAKGIKKIHCVHVCDSLCVCGGGCLFLFVYVCSCGCVCSCVSAVLCVCAVGAGCRTIQGDEYTLKQRSGESLYREVILLLMMLRTLVNTHTRTRTDTHISSPKVAQKQEGMGTWRISD